MEVVKVQENENGNEKADDEMKVKGKERLDNAAKALAFARSSASAWQLRMLTLQGLALGGIGVVKSAASEANAAYLLPWIAIAMFSVASLVIFLASGFLKAARFWQEKVDGMLEVRDYEDYRRVIGGFYAGRLSVVLGVIPAIAISIIVAIPAFAASCMNSTASCAMFVTLLIVSIASFLSNLWVSTKAEHAALSTAVKG